MSGQRARGPAEAPPPLARLLLRLATHPSDRRFVLGDLDQEYADRSARLGRGAARRWYRDQVMRSLPASLRSRVARSLRQTADETARNLRTAVRSLVGAPLTTLVAVVSLSVGIAVSTTVFALGRSFLARPVSEQIVDPQALAVVYTSSEDDVYGQTSFPDYLDLRAQATSFSDLAAERMAVVRMGHDARRRSMIEQVTGNYFDLLGVHPALGPGFTAATTAPGRAEQVAIVSYAYWREELRADPGVIGTVLPIDERPFAVVGVAPPDMRGRVFALAVDAWVPLGIPGGLYHANEQKLADRSERQYAILGRLAPGATTSTAAAELDVIGRRLADRYPEDWQDDHGEPHELLVMAEPDARVPPDMLAALRSGIFSILLAAALVLGLACANVALLLIARGDRRASEIAIRRALGADRRRLVAMLLTESLLLGLGSGSMGLWASARAVAWLSTISLPIGDLSLRFAVGIDTGVTLFAFLVSVATGVLFGLLPAIEASRARPLASMRGTGLVGSRMPRRLSLRRLLIVVQVTVAVIFVVGCSVAYRSFGDLLRLDWGVRPDGLAVATVEAPEGLDGDARTSWIHELRGRLEARPEVRATGVSTVAEGSFVATMSSAAVRIDGYEPEDRVESGFNAVTPGYFDMVGIRLSRGRGFRESDDRGAPRVAVVNESLAHQLWPDRDPVGERFQVVARRYLADRDTTTTEYEVIGLAPDARYRGFETTGSNFFWTALYQGSTHYLVLTAEGSPNAGAAIPLLRRVAAETERDLPLVTARAYADLLRGQFEFLRFSGRLLGWAAAFGMLLAMMGVYGTVAQGVIRRRREMAVRQAVGALPGEVVRALLGDGLRLGIWGLALGLAVAIPVTAALRSGLGGIAPIDVPAALLGAIVLLLATSLASLVPALRITRVDVAASLRQD